MIKTRQKKQLPTLRQRLEFQARERLSVPPQRLVITCDDAALDQQIIPLLFEDASLVARLPAARIPTEDSQVHRDFWEGLQFAVAEYELQHIVIMGHSQCSYFPTILQQQMERLAWDEDFDFQFNLAEQTRQVQDQLIRTQNHTIHQLELLQDAIQVNGWDRRGFQHVGRHAWYFLHESQWLLQLDATSQQFLPLNQTGV